MILRLLSRNGWKMLSCAVFSSAMLYATLQSKAQTITTNSQGTHNGYFYSFWTDNSQGSASMTLGPAGNYSTTSSNVGNFIAGKGWATGNPYREICFSGSFNAGNNGFLSLYGWTKNNLIEYYVCENYGKWTPPGTVTAPKGTYVSDGGTYTIYELTRTNQLTIIGFADYRQYWSVRTQKRTSGTITFANHVAAWKNAGMHMGTTWAYQIMATEEYMSTGNSNITIHECNSCSTPAPTVTASITYELGDIAKQLTATGTNLKWYSTETGGTASTTAPTPSTSTVGTTDYYVTATDSCESTRSSITVHVVQAHEIYSAAANPITIDGNIESIWNDAYVKPLNTGTTFTGSISDSTDLSATAKVLWDNTYLYLLAEVNDDSLKNDSPNAYDDDAIEFYIDINNDKATAYGTNDFQYTFGWNDGTTVGVLPSGGSKIGIAYSMVTTSKGYIIEAKIPWSTLNGTPMPDQLIGIDFMVNDDDDGSTRDAKLYWNAKTDQAYTNTSLFGTGKLISQFVLTKTDDGFTSDHISVYPNPVTDNLYINGFTGDYEYVVSDESGRTVLKGQSAEKIDVAELEAGVYIVKIKQDERSKTIKISKF